MTPVRITILTDDRLFREGLSRIIDTEATLLRVESDRQPDILLVDGRMESALHACRATRDTARPRVLFVAAPDDDAWAREALNAGARGVLPKASGAATLLKAIEIVHGGLVWAPRRVIVACLDQLARPAEPPEGHGTAFEQRLTAREIEVFRSAARGLANKELAQRFAISEATVKVHLMNIFKKLGLRGRGELAALYCGLIPPPAAGANGTPPRRRSVRAQVD